MIQIIDIDSLVPFENHPFKERSGIEQQELTESIKENGLLEPIIVRPFPAGKYEIISGHRRAEACKALGVTSIPVIIKELTKDEAIVQMVDSNIHREHILPSEKSFAYKMKLEALKHQGKTYGQVVHKSRDNISDTESGRNVQRYIRLTYLIPELLRLVDEEEQVVFGDEDYFEKKDTDLKNTIEWIIPNAQRNMMEPIRLTLAPGGATYPDLPHEGEEFGYVLQGSVKIHVGNKVYKAKKGESFYFTPHAKHYIEASSSSGARLIWVSTPPSF